jgi:signal transduction histidine kinase
MASIWQRASSIVRQLRWSLTLSYTAVTVGTLLVVVLIAGAFVYSRILVPHNVLSPEVWAYIVSENAPTAWNYVLAQSPVDTDLLALMLEDAVETGDLQITHYDLFRLGDLQLTARTLGQGDVLIVGADGTLLGTSSANLVSEEAVGQPIELDLLPGLEGPLRAALAGEVDPGRLFVTIDPEREFFFVVPFLEEGTQRVLAAGIIYVQALPTESDLPANLLGLVGRSLLILTLTSGLVGALFGAITASGLAKRFERISRTTESWSHGDLTEFIDDPRSDEVGQLARRLNTMAERLQKLLQRRQEMAISEERNRLARELHDSAKQQALAASFQLGTAITLFERDPQSARKHLAEADSLLDEVRVELTGLIHELRPQAADGRSFDAMLDDYVVEWAHQNGIEVQFRVQGTGELSLETEQALFRITQEALANIARHSAADRAAVSLTYGLEVVSLTVADDGCGFDTGLQHGGLGLHSMRERAESLRGIFAIESSLREGTCVSVTLPAG